MPQIGYGRRGRGARGHYFQRGRARAEIRVTLRGNAAPNTKLSPETFNRNPKTTSQSHIYLLFISAYLYYLFNHNPPKLHIRFQPFRNLQKIAKNDT